MEGLVTKVGRVAAASSLRRFPNRRSEGRQSGDLQLFLFLARSCFLDHSVAEIRRSGNPGIHHHRIRRSFFPASAPKSCPVSESNESSLYSSILLLYISLIHEPHRCISRFLYNIVHYNTATPHCDTFQMLSPDLF